MSAEHISKFAALYRKWWRLHLSEKLSSGTKNHQKKPINSSLVKDFRSAPLLKKAFLSSDEDQKGSFCRWRWLSSKFVRDVYKDEFHNYPQCGFWVEHNRTCFHFPKQRDTAVTWLKNCRYGVKLHPFNQSISHFSKQAKNFHATISLQVLIGSSNSIKFAYQTRGQSID